MEISQEGLALVQAEGKRSLPSLSRYFVAEFPQDTVRISFKEANILNPSSFVARIREAHQQLCTSQTRISLALPDATGRLLVLDMETRFKNRDEGIDLIRWKLKKNFPLDINDVHLDYQVLQYRETGEISVLVGLISRQVISQYEDLLLEAGLEPSRIDFATLSIYRLLADRCNENQHTAYISWFRGTIGVMVFTDGVLDFYRHKDIQGRNPEANRIFREINSSLLVYSDKRPGQQLQKVFFATEPDDRALLQGVVGEATSLEPTYIDLDPFIQRSHEKIDRQVFSKLLVAFAAATRTLR
jgi:type IV pilus assembly protein PilM